MKSDSAVVADLDAGRNADWIRDLVRAKRKQAVASAPKRHSPKYSPDQPRDERGRFEGGSGSGGGINQAALHAWVNGMVFVTEHIYAEMRRAIAASPPTDHDVYRGMGRAWSKDPNRFDRFSASLQVGAEFTMRPSSFSSNRDTALSAATGTWNGTLHDGDIVFRLSAGAQAVDVEVAGGYRGTEDMFSGQKEFISGGRFQVTDVSYEDGAKLVGIKQIGLWT